MGAEFLTYTPDTSIGAVGGCRNPGAEHTHRRVVQGALDSKTVWECHYSFLGGLWWSYPHDLDGQYLILDVCEAPAAKIDPLIV